MKLAFTMSDAGAALHIGGQVNTTTHVVEIPDALLPLRVKQYLEGKDRPGCYWSMAISLVDESESAEIPASLFERLAKRPASENATTNSHGT